MSRRRGRRQRRRRCRARVSSGLRSARTCGASSRAGGPAPVRAEPEGLPHLAVPARRRRAPIAPAAALRSHGGPRRGRPPPLELTPVEDHGDSRVVAEALGQLLAELRAIAADHHEPRTQPGPRRPCALMAPVRAGSRPRNGAHASPVSPLSIALLAIVRVVAGARRDGQELGQGSRQSPPRSLQTLPEHLPAPQEAARAQALELLRPLVPEPIVHQESPGRLHGGVRSRTRSLEPVPLLEGRDRQGERLHVGRRRPLHHLIRCGGVERRRVTASLSGPDKGTPAAR